MSSNSRNIAAIPGHFLQVGQNNALKYIVCRGPSPNAMSELLNPIEKAILLEIATRPPKRLDVHNSEVPVLCRSCEARHQGICGVLTPDQLVTLSRNTIKHTVEPDRAIVREGETEQRFSNIMSGVVKLSKLTEDGRRQIVGLQFAPDFLGRPFSHHSDCEVEAATEVKLCSFPRATLLSMIKSSPELEHKLFTQASRELQEAHDWMLTLGRKTATEKVAAFLHFVATRINPESAEATSPLLIDLPLNRSDIADFLGLTIETVSRQITKLRTAGVIVVVNNRTIEIPDVQKLAKFSS
jgi:CRP/FNR family transcriptional regulator, anaerobic regulatory protein